jgi:alpha-L-fucosidase
VKKTDTWFDTARFGMFVHWGHCSQHGCELSWPLVGGVAALPQAKHLSVAEYHSTAATFNPQDYDPVELARLAKRVGMQYAILTAKHHDGYAIYHTRQNDFSIEHSPYGKDITRMFLDAMRAEGLRVGVYFSLIDWHHPDYPAFTDEDRPYRWGQWRRSSPEAWARFQEFMFGQIRELLTDYGKIDIIWFDGGWERMPDEWKATELEALIRSLQPEILINDRLPGAGDYTTPEQFVPPQVPDRAWECCMTINESWGYNPDDKAFKSGRQLVHTICEIAARGGNLLLNVGPMADGKLPPELLERLAVIEGWMARHAESIIGTEPGLEPWQFYGPSTRRGDRIYLHLLMKPYDTVAVRGLPIRRVRAVRALGVDRELAFTARAPIIETLFGTDPVGEITITVPEDVVDPWATVLVVDVG